MSRKSISLIAAAALLLAGFASGAAAAEWQEGQHYQVITPAVETSPDVVEVVEVFSYACPHCAHFQPWAQKLEAGLPPGAVYVHKPAVFFAQWEPFARAWLTAKSMGVAGKTHQALFDALHRDHKPLRTIEQLAQFYAGFGVDPGQFLSTANSFVINDQMQKDVTWERAAGVMGTPTIIVAGKYRADASMAGSNEKLAQLALWLAEKEIAARNGKQ